MNCNEKKAKKLGMPLGTAQARLRKMILFQLVQETGKDICFKCGKKIELLEDLSIEHKIPWLHVNISLFWDLNNIAFSHLSCNINGAYQPNKKNALKGMAWCNMCKKYLPIKLFSKYKTRWNGLQTRCKKCRHNIFLEKGY